MQPSCQEKRAAQLFGGFDVPTKLFEAVLKQYNGTNICEPNDHLCVLHMSPLDGCVEFVDGSGLLEFHRTFFFEFQTTC